VLKASDEHGSVLRVEDRVATGLELFKSRCVNGSNRRLGRTADRSGSLRATATLAIAVEGYAPIFGMDGAVMAEKKIASDEGAATLQTLERPLFRVCILC
jgi:hypothetical protein